MSKGKVQGLGDHSLGSLILDGKRYDAHIDGSTTLAGLQRTITGASTVSISVEDPERYLQGGGYYSRRADLLLDDLWFRLAHVGKTGDLFNLVFEDRDVAIQRLRTKARKMSRAHATRAQFLQALIAEIPHLLFVCPELTHKQAIAPFTKADQTTLDRNRARGIAYGADFHIKNGPGSKATRQQIKNLNRALNVAESIGAGHLATLAMLCSGIGESGWMSIMNGAGSPYGGVLQGNVRNGTFALGDVEGMAESFLRGGKGFQAGGAIAIAKAHPGMDPGEIATRVEAGGAAASFYGQWKSQAQIILDLYGGVDATASSDAGSQRAYVKQYEFSRGAPGGPKGEDTWDCGIRLANEVQWRWFMVASVQYFIADRDLILSRPRMTIDEASPGIDDIDYELDTSDKVPTEVTVYAHAKRWEAPPGTVVALKPTMGDAAGAWIVSDINRPDITADATTITLTRPEPAKKEPASQVLLRSSVPSTDGGLITGPDTGHGAPSIDPLNPSSIVARAYRKAQAIDTRHYPYVYGGGHVKAGSPSTIGGVTGYDCSGGVCALLFAAGILRGPPPYVENAVILAQDLTRWGHAGKGQYFTVWAKDEGGGNGHCFAEFTLPSGTVFFEFHHTGTIGGLESSRDTTGFTPRHWPGT